MVTGLQGFKRQMLPAREALSSPGGLVWKGPGYELGASHLSLHRSLRAIYPPCMSFQCLTASGSSPLPLINL